MSKLMLDIGAGGSYFAQLFRKLNPHLDVTVLCGEPNYGTRLHTLMNWRRIKKISACYNNFGLPDNSLDIVTLNSYHPFTPPRGIEAEVLRCLRPGGLFISAHPVGFMPRISNEGGKSKLLTLIESRDQRTGKAFSSFKFTRTSGSFYRHESRLILSGAWGTIRYPASQTIESRFKVLYHPHAYQSSAVLNAYIYRGWSEEPTVSLWRCEG